jgi:hypothetical protein
MTLRELQAYAGRWRRALWTRELAWAGAAGLSVAAVAGWWGAVAAGVVLAVRLRRVRPWRLGVTDVTRHLDRVVPALEESAGLWLRRDEALTVVEKIQLRRVDAAYARVAAAGWAAWRRPEVRLERAVVALLAGGILGAASVASRGGGSGGVVGQTVQATATAIPTAGRRLPAPRVAAVRLEIAPPAYTARPERRVAEFDTEVEEGARVRWAIAVEGDVQTLALEFGEGGGTLTLARGGTGEFSGERFFAAPALYRLTGRSADGSRWEPPALHAVRVVKDLAPVVTITEPAAARTELAAVGDVAVRVAVKDDYAVGAAQVIATVAKGSGEGVKFREQALAFDAVSGVGGARVFEKTLDLRRLGLEPGDELYFYVTATDNRAPVANRTRSETRFISVKGPEQVAVATGRGVRGVNLVPEYFRSQRQIIIDTEKLVAEQATLSAAEFRRRAEDLGIDQKLLRLRYGQFLGEEFEPEKDARPDHHAPVAGTVGEFVAQLTQKRQTGPLPAGKVPSDKPVVVPHDHGPETGSGREGPKTAAEITAEFAHLHDKADEATFFDSKQKASLKDVLAAMWEAEGFLRVIQPAAALPAEHRALALLKELQEGERAYVQRVGFEAAPIKIAERRLRGELASVPERLPTAAGGAAEAESSLTALRAGMAATGTTGALGAEARAAWLGVEPALTRAATREPATYLGALQALRGALADGVVSVEAAEAVRRALWRLLPAAEPAPGRRTDDAPELAEAMARARQAEVGR